MRGDPPIRRALRSRWTPVLAAPGLTVVFLVLGAVLAQIGEPSVAAVGAAVLTGVLVLDMYLLAGSEWVRGLDPPGRRRLLLACWAVQPALVSAVLLAAFGVDGPWAVAGAAVTGSVAAVAYVGLGADTSAPAPRPRRPASPPHRPESPPHRSESPPHRPEPPAVTRPRSMDPDAQLGRARALLAKGGRPELDEALPLLRKAIADPAVDPALALAVTDDLVDAESVRAERSRDDRPYAEALALLSDVVQRCPDLIDGRIKLHSHRAQYLTFQAGRATVDLRRAIDRRDAAAQATMEVRIHDLYVATEAELRKAVHAAPAGTPAWARESAALGLLLCRGVDHGEPDRSDEGIALIRRAVDPRIALSPHERTMARLDLASALSMRAWRGGSTGDVTEARQLLGEVANAGPEYEAETRTLLAGLVEPR